MPGILRSERRVTGAQLSALGAGAIGLVTNNEPRAVILPLQVLAIPYTIAPFLGSTNSQLWIGDVQLSDVSGFEDVMNAGQTLNLLGASSMVPISGKVVSDLLGRDLMLKLSGTLTGGDAIITIVAVYHIAYPTIP